MNRALATVATSLAVFGVSALEICMSNLPATLLRCRFRRRFPRCAPTPHSSVICKITCCVPLSGSERSVRAAIELLTKVSYVASTYVANAARATSSVNVAKLIMLASDVFAT
jgi:hypothetical protein